MTIPFSPPDISELEIAEVTEALRSGWITTGPKTKMLEEAVASYCRTDKAVCLASQTAAAELVLRLMGIGPGDEVITSSYTYTASCSIICHVGATPVLIDTAPGSYEMDYDALEAAITDKAKAIIPVDIAGMICDYGRIFEIAENARSIFLPNGDLQEALGRIAVLGDTAHSFGATRAGRISGEIADFSSFSFHAVKNFTTAEGGAVTWRGVPGISSEDIYRRLMLLSLHGQDKDALAKARLGAWEYDIVGTYYKCNMTDIMAALGLAQMKRYGGLLARRRELICMYDGALKDDGLSILRHCGDGFSGSGHLYMVRLPGRDERFRNEVIVKMAEAGIACNVHYKPLPMFTAYKRLGFDINDFQNAFSQYQNEITLPLHTLLTDEQAEYVTDTFKAVLRRMA